MSNNQGNIVAGCLIFAFFFYVTTKGNLPRYMGFLFGSTSPSTSNPAAAASPGGFQGVWNTLMGAANQLLTVLPAY